MFRFIFLTFAVLAWGFFELSGGTDFEPPKPDLDARKVLATYDIQERTLPPVDPDSMPDVARRDTAEALVTLASVPTTTRTAASPATEPKVTPEPTSVRPVALDVRVVTGSRVNIRSGPGTDFTVLGQLVRDDKAIVINDPGSGWVQIRTDASEQVGWMAARLLRSQNR